MVDLTTIKDKYTEKLWCDLNTDLERSDFISCGRAWDTGIIAQEMCKEVAQSFMDRHIANTTGAVK